MTETSSHRLGFIFLVIVWFCWGFSYPATKITLQGIDVWTSRLLIMGLGGALLLLLASITRKTVRVPRKDWADLSIAAVLNMTIFQIGMTLGVHYFSAGRTVVIVYTMPLWAMIFAWPMLGEIPNLKRISALSLGLIGLCQARSGVTHRDHEILSVFRQYQKSRPKYLFYLRLKLQR